MHHGEGLGFYSYIGYQNRYKKQKQVEDLVVRRSKHKKNVFQHNVLEAS